MREGNTQASSRFIIIFELMANTFTQLHVHLVFAVKYRRAMIATEWKERLHEYISGIIRQSGHKVIQVNCMPDHIHILIGLRPNQSLSDLVKLIKTRSTVWVKDNGFCEDRFAWQEGFGAFSYSKSQLNRVINYIINQEAHHSKVNFNAEFERILQKRGIDYEQKYLFTKPD